MTKSYSDKLKDPRWQKTRLKIMERDGWKCVVCGNHEDTFHVHHTRYERGKDPWDYSPELLITLCASCHECYHQNLDAAIAFVRGVSPEQLCVLSVIFSWLSSLPEQHSDALLASMYDLAIQHSADWEGCQHGGGLDQG